jgi:large subunit ribosomal protein L44e
MKHPKTIRTVCPICRTHTEHTVKAVKKKGRSQAHPMSQSQKRFERKMKGYGGFPRPKPKGEGKTTKKVDLRYQCKKCNKMHTRKGFRIKKIEFV